MRSLQEHLDDPALPPPPPDATIEGCAGGSCGVLAHFFLTVDAGLITACTARVRGRAAALAAASALCEAAQGRSIVDAARLGLSTLHPDFAELDQEDVERARVVEDGFHHALGQHVLQQMRDKTALAPVGQLTAVAMSGGVDSAVALHEMHARTGGEVVGVTLRLWIDPKAPDPEAACCSPDSVRRARGTCHAIGAPHFSLDLRDAFALEVVAPFIDRYRAGETPNPCVGCNGDFRLAELVAFADAIGAGSVATGHYVRTVERGGQVLLQRGVDERKDQSYMLSTLAPRVVARFRFPLGGLTKPQTRARAGELGLAQATVGESQEICFLGGGDYRQFLGRMQAMGPAGEIRTSDGAVLGRHEGIAGFTPGQRRGLGVQQPTTTGTDVAPLYVLDTDPQSGQVTVGLREQLRTREVLLEDAQAYEAGLCAANVKLRYRARSSGQRAQIEWLHAGAARLVFDEPVMAPAPGQTACMYDEAGVVVGAGRIVRSAG